MKKYKPSPFLNLSHWPKMVIEYLVLLILMIVMHKLEIKGVRNNIIFNDFIYTFLLLFLYKILGTFTDVVSIVFEDEQITFDYWYFYIVKKQITIEFKDLDFKTRNDILILGGSFGIYFYKNSKLKIKINRRNGWKDKQIDELIEDLLLRKKPTLPLKKRFSYD